MEVFVLIQSRIYISLDAASVIDLKRLNESIISISDNSKIDLRQNAIISINHETNKANDDFIIKQKKIGAGNLDIKLSLESDGSGNEAIKLLSNNGGISLLADTIIDLELDNESIIKISQPNTINLRQDKPIKFTHLVSNTGDNLVIEQLNGAGIPLDMQLCIESKVQERST